MSTRQLRRLRNLVKQQQPKNEEEEEEEEEEDEIIEPTNRSSNFNVLMMSSSEEEEEENVDNEVVVVPVSIPKKKKKKKKKRSSSKDDEELLNTLAITSAKTNSEYVKKKISSLESLRVKRSFLREENEIRRKFGKKISKGNRTRHRKNKKNRKLSKRLELVMPDSRWPSPPTFLGGGLGMEHEKNTFSFRASSEYLEIDNTFRLASSHALDPETLIRLVQRYPFHTTGLLQLSDMMRQLGRMEDSARLVRRGMYVFQNAFHPLFDVDVSGLPPQMTCLNDETFNRTFFEMTFRHMMFLFRRGCPRTALEFAKFLLSLDIHTDPMGILLCIDGT